MARKITYTIREIDKPGITYRFQCWKRVEWPGLDQGIHKPIEFRFDSAQTKDAAVGICRTAGSWQSISDADAGGRSTEVVYQF